jgi:hypothetical protein
MRRIFPALGLALALASAPGARNIRAEERPPVHAEQGSVAIVNSNLTGATITIGVAYEKLEAAVRSRTKDLKDLTESEKETNALEKLDLNQRQVKSALEILGEANVPPERLAAKLVEIAIQYKKLKTAAAAQLGDDSKITALKAEAQKAIQNGELAKADEILAKVEKIQDEALERPLLTPRKPPPSAAMWP